MMILDGYLLFGPPCIQSGPQKSTHFVRLITSSILTNCQNFFTVRIRRKLVIVLSLKIPLHIKCVATQSTLAALWNINLQRNNWKQNEFCNNTF